MYRWVHDAFVMLECVTVCSCMHVREDTWLQREQPSTSSEMIAALLLRPIQSNPGHEPNVAVWHDGFRRKRHGERRRV